MSRRPSTFEGSTYAPSDDLIHNGVAWASSPTVDPWDPAILCFGEILALWKTSGTWTDLGYIADGGGIRGYSSLLILQTLMHEIAAWERKLQQESGLQRTASDDTINDADLLPCHYFDFMYGTSTGGLIATMLGRLRMTVPQCTEIYREVGDSLFSKHVSGDFHPTVYSSYELNVLTCAN